MKALKKISRAAILLWAAWLLPGSASAQQAVNCNSCVGGSTNANSQNCHTGAVVMPVGSGGGIGSAYELILEDHFDGTQLSVGDPPYNWHWDIPYAQAGSICCNDITNAIVANGYVNLQIKYAPTSNCYDVIQWGDPSQSSSYFSTTYTSAILNSNTYFGPGKFEVYCKIPFMHGQWPAFWLYEANSPDNVYHQQEIDHFEIKQDAPGEYCSWNSNCGEMLPDDAASRLIMTTHYRANEDVEQCAKQKCHMTTEPLSDDFHKYTLIWDDDFIEWYLDDIRVHRADRYVYDASTGNYIEDLDFPDPNIKMKLILGSSVWSQDLAGATVYNAAGNLVPVCGSPPMPQDFLVDYVKVWRRSCISTGTVTACANTDFQNNAIYQAGTLHVNTSPSCVTWTLASGQTQTMIGVEEITIKNFEAQAGSSFTAKLKPCPYSTARLAHNEDPVQEENSASSTPAAGDLTIVPNPSNGEFSLLFNRKLEGEREIVIYNFVGQEVFRKQVNPAGGESTLGLSSLLSPGAYLLRVDGVEQAARLIINEK